MIGYDQKEGVLLTENEILTTVFVCVLVIPLMAVILCKIFSNPFEYPYFTHTFDITGKRNIEVEDYIDEFLRNEKNWHTIQLHQHKIQQWKKKSENYIRSCRLQEYRNKQYENILDDQRAFHFEFIRMQTRYQQVNYVKTAYKVPAVYKECSIGWKWLSDRYSQLEKIGFEATLRDYNSNNQRRLMTSSLRKQIMERDNYTCQICGKYMPDEVGLHIDHIVPIAKGGRSIHSNLQVLCSKCNGRKGTK